MSDLGIELKAPCGGFKVSGNLAFNPKTKTLVTPIGGGIFDLNVYPLEVASALIPFFGESGVTLFVNNVYNGNSRYKSLAIGNTADFMLRTFPNRQGLVTEQAVEDESVQYQYGLVPVYANGYIPSNNQYDTYYAPTMFVYDEDSNKCYLIMPVDKEQYEADSSQYRVKAIDFSNDKQYYCEITEQSNGYQKMTLHDQIVPRAIPIKLSDGNIDYIFVTADGELGLASKRPN